MTLRITLLGTISIKVDETSLTDQLPRKALALLAIMAVTGKAQARDRLTELLWPEQTPERASGSLRSLLTEMRGLLGDYLTITRQTVAFSTSPWWADASDFAQQTERFQRSQADLSDERFNALEKAMELMRGEFMPGFHLPNNNDFEQWLIEQREWLQHQYMQCGLELIAALRQRGNTNRAIYWAHQLIRSNPLHEEAHQQMMRALAESGARAAALEHYEKLRTQLKNELDVEPDSATTALYHVIRSGDLSRPATPSTPKPILETSKPRPEPKLPPQPYPFIGREHELGQIQTLLISESCRLLTLVGPGGIGKTRLAIEAARRLAGHFADGVYFVALASVNDAGLIPATIADAINIPHAGRNDIQQHLFNYLAQKSLLLVLDNFEHVVDASLLVSDILSRAPQVSVIATSRVRLDLMEEWTLSIEGLLYPPPGQERQNPEQYQSLEMFSQAARRARPSFALEPHLHAVARICQLMQGLPLGIELAAAWVRVMEPGEIVKNIEQRVDFLTSTMRNMPERHRSMRAVFEWSWNLLTSDEQDVLRRLAVFRGGFTLEAAQRITHHPQMALLILNSLVEKSLLHAQSHDAHYALHELVRQFAEEKLQAVASLLAEVEARHAAYYAEFMKAREDRLDGALHHGTIREVVREMDNIRAAWKYSVSHCDAALLRSFLRAVYHLYDGQSLYVEGEAAFRAAESCLRQLDPQLTMFVTIRGALYRGFFLHLMAHYPEASAIFEEVLPLLQNLVPREEGAAWDLRLMLGYLAAMFYAQGDFVQSRHYYEASVEMYRQMGQMTEAGEPLMRLSDIAVVMGEYQHAKQIIQESLPLFWEASTRRSRILFLTTLGDIDCKLGAFTEAKQYFEEALTLARTLNYRINTGVGLVSLGRVAYGVGEYAEAETQIRESLLIFGEVRHRWGMSFARTHLGRVLTAMGRFSEAREHFLSSLSICQEIGNRWVECFTLRQFAELHARQDDWEKAAYYLQSALQIAYDINVLPLTLDALAGIAVCLTQSGLNSSALRIATFVSNHPVTEFEGRNESNRVLETLKSHQSIQDAYLTLDIVVAEARDQIATLHVPR